MTDNIEIFVLSISLKRIDGNPKEISVHTPYNSYPVEEGETITVHIAKDCPITITGYQNNG